MLRWQGCALIYLHVSHSWLYHTGKMHVTDMLSDRRQDAKDRGATQVSSISIDNDQHAG